VLQQIRNGLGPPAFGPLGSPFARLQDVEIRQALLELLRDGANPEFQTPCADLTERDCVVVEELALARGYVKADIAVSTSGKLHVYEIKSDRDNLTRLPEQIRVYGEVSNHVTLVVGWKHVAAALRTAPQWWEIWLAERVESGGLIFVPLRGLGENPNLNIRSLAVLIPPAKAREIVQAGNFASSQAGCSLRNLYSHLARTTSLEELRAHVHSCLCRRSTVAVQS
jgi:hypothetical protein